MQKELADDHTRSALMLFPGSPVVPLLLLNCVGFHRSSRPLEARVAVDFHGRSFPLPAVTISPGCGYLRLLLRCPSSR